MSSEEEATAEGLDRSMQRQILINLAKIYPAVATKSSEFGFDKSDRKFVRNLIYLRGHDLVFVRTVPGVTGFMPTVSFACITSKGLDFLSDDGGLSAILGVVTVRLHDDTVRQILRDAVDEARIPAAAKEKLKSAITDLPAEGLKAAVPALLRRAADLVPDAIAWIEKSLGP